MKRFALATLAAITLAGPLAATAAYADPPARHDNRGDMRRDNDRHDNGRWDNDRRDDRRDARNDNRWDQRRHNGYTYNGRWNYGPPPAAFVNRPGFQPGYHQWRRGERLPAYYRSHYRQVDYRRERLRAPPRGYHYVRDDRGDVLMVAIATGLIASIILSQ